MVTDTEQHSDVGYVQSLVEIVKLTDKLVTNVVKGDTGSIRLALDIAGKISAIKRRFGQIK